MGFYVHLNLVMKCLDHDGLIQLAKNHIENVKDCIEAEIFLHFIADGKGYCCGHKGALLTWGIVGNYSCAEHFINVLMPFLHEMYEKEVGPHDFEHILIFCELEQSEQAKAYEISYEENHKKIHVKEHVCNFAWMQF